MNCSDVPNMQDTLCALVERETCTSKVSPETRLDELGIDSLEFVDLMLAIGSEFREIPDVRWAELNTVGDILKVLSDE